MRTNGNPDNVGRSAVFARRTLAESPFAENNWIYASYLIRARLGPDFDPIYVTAYLASPEGRRQLRDESKTSAGQYNINIDGLSSVRVPAAETALQREFAAKVTAIETQRAVLERALAADDELFASLQSRAFRGEL